VWDLKWLLGNLRSEIDSVLDTQDIDTFAADT
jgi:hypothetical protein